MGLVIDMCSRTMLWLVLASFSIREMMISDEANGRKADSAVFLQFQHHPSNFVSVSDGINSEDHTSNDFIS